MIDTPSRTAQTDFRSTSQQTKLAIKMVVDKSDFPNLLKNQTPFNIENELAKLKNYIPLIELVSKIVYRTQVMKSLNIGENTNSVNLNDDQP